MNDIERAKWYIENGQGEGAFIIASLLEEITNNKVQHTELLARVEELEKILNVINDIRNSIVGLQTMNWSEHVYPLVSALESAGIKGMEYPEAKANVGTLLNRIAELEREDTALCQYVKDMMELDYPTKEELDVVRRSAFERAIEICEIQMNNGGSLGEAIESIRNEMSTSLCPTCKKHPCEHSHGGKVTVCVLYDEMEKGE